MPARITPFRVLQGLLLLVALIAPMAIGPYWIHVGALAWYYALLASSWALLAGYAGQFSFAHVAFAALGGYGSALLTLRLGLPLALSLPLTVLIAMGLGALMGALVLRLSGPYLALFTLAIAEIFRLMLVAEDDLTRGSLGLEVPGLFPNGSDVPYYYLGLGLVALALLLMNFLLMTRVGVFLRAIREDEPAAQASGVNTTLHKIIVFVTTAGIAAAAGSYYGHFVGILSLNMVIIPEMGLVIAMAVIGSFTALFAATIAVAHATAAAGPARRHGSAA